MYSVSRPFFFCKLLFKKIKNDTIEKKKNRRAGKGAGGGGTARRQYLLNFSGSSGSFTLFLKKNYDYYERLSINIKNETFEHRDTIMPESYKVQDTEKWKHVAYNPELEVYFFYL